MTFYNINVMTNNEIEYRDEKERRTGEREEQ
jgi:hypothetical protein